MNNGLHRDVYRSDTQLLSWSPVLHYAVYTGDQLPMNVGTLNCSVINTDPQNTSGCHWFAIYIISSRGLV